MTMSSPAESAAVKTGWFDSLRRNRRNKSVGSTHTIDGNRVNHMSGAKSMSSLYSATLSTTVIHCTDASTASTVSASRLDLSQKSKSMSSWRSLLHRGQGVKATKKSEVVTSALTHSVAKQVPLPVAASPPPPTSSSSSSSLDVDGDKSLSSAFWTLPRKRGGNGKQPDSSRPPVPPTNRSRSYSITSLERRNKRSTVWYTHSEGDFRSRLVSFLFLRCVPCCVVNTHTRRVHAHSPTLRGLFSSPPLFV